MPRRRRKQPSQLRFLRGFLWGLPFLLIAIAGPIIAGIMCQMARKQGVQTCPSLPTIYFVLPVALFTAGCLFSAWRYYRDFVRGDLARERGGFN